MQAIHAAGLPWQRAPTGIGLEKRLRHYRNLRISMEANAQSATAQSYDLQPCLHRQLTTCSNDAVLFPHLTSYSTRAAAGSCSFKVPSPTFLVIQPRLCFPFRSRSRCLAQFTSTKVVTFHRRSFCGEQVLDVDASCSSNLQHMQITKIPSNTQR